VGAEPAVPYPRAARGSSDSAGVVRIGSVAVGGPDLVVLAGPHDYHDRAQVFAATAGAVSGGAAILHVPLPVRAVDRPALAPLSRARAKPPPLRALGEVRRRFDRPVLTTVDDLRQLPHLALVADAVQIRAGQMQDFALLRAAGRLTVPVVVARGMGATVTEWLLAAEYVLAGGNEAVILSEPGVRTHEPGRLTVDLGAALLAKQRGRLPVIVDLGPQGAHPDLVGPLALAAAAAGIDGILVDIAAVPSVVAAGPADMPIQPRYGVDAFTFGVMLKDLDKQLASAGRALTKQ
jgi:3-deoxy-7-phosphoheptulonate synthase